jgi:spoIIIJ-associated protein
LSDPITVEANGETVGEAKWNALRELERRFPGLDRHGVEFHVVSEGERGLMGIGREPARVVATLTAAPSAEQQEAAQRLATSPPAPRVVRPRQAPTPAPTGPEADTATADDVRQLLGAILTGLGMDATVHVGAADDYLLATVSGSDLGVLIGKHGHTIDAVQYIVNAIISRREDAISVVVDAQHYRSRREATLHDAAEQAARDALSSGRPVALEPMSSVERKIVHLYLKDREDVETTSDGREPLRHVVVRPTEP